MQTYPLFLTPGLPARCVVSGLGLPSTLPRAIGAAAARVQGVKGLGLALTLNPRGWLRVYPNSNVASVLFASDFTPGV